MPYDTYRLYQIERAKSPAEVQRADEQAARLISAVSSLLRGLTRPVRAIRRPYPRPLRSAYPAQRGARPAQQDTVDRPARRSLWPYEPLPQPASPPCLPCQDLTNTAGQSHTEPVDRRVPCLTGPGIEEDTDSAMCALITGGHVPCS